MASSTDRQNHVDINMLRGVEIVKNFRSRLLTVFALVLLASVVSCDLGGLTTQVNITTLSSAADGLDLQAVGELLKRAENAEQFETLLNDPSEGLNNLDLDEDDNVDFIQITEYGQDDATGFSLTVDMGGGEEQELATIDVVKTDEGDVDVEVHGNEQVYGANHYHHQRFGAGDYLLFAYLFRPHPFYFSPYRFGFYPGYYRPYPVVGLSNYRTRTSTVVGNSTTQLSRSSVSTQSRKATSPNAGRTSSRIKAPLKNPTGSQKAFQTRNPSKQIGSGGFGTKRTSVRGSRSTRGGGSSRGGK